MLVDVFKHPEVFVLGCWGPDDRNPYAGAVMFKHVMRVPGPVLLRAQRTPSAVTDQSDFKKNWRAFTDGSLDSLNWKNVVAAGGAPLAWYVCEGWGGGRGRFHWAVGVGYPGKKRLGGDPANLHTPPRQPLAYARRGGG